jgi:hypothetical protein
MSDVLEVARNTEPRGAPVLHPVRVAAPFGPATGEGGSLRFLPLRVQCRSLDLALEMGGTFGPLWRSGFGVALQRSFSGVFDLLFADQARLGRLYALRPPVVAVRPGQIFEIGINLFGPATEHALVCAQAVEQLGKLGLGSPRGHFTLERAWVEGASEDFMRYGAGLTAWPTPLQLLDLVPQARGIRQLQLHFETPLRIKAGNRPCTTGPDFLQLVRRLAGRLAHLAEAAGETNPLPLAMAQQLLADAPRIQRLDDAVHWAEIHRSSARTRQTMSFGGLMGSLTFGGPLDAYADLLALAEIMQLGGKTTFGFGCLRNTFYLED